MHNIFPDCLISLIKQSNLKLLHYFSKRFDAMTFTTFLIFPHEIICGPFTNCKKKKEDIKNQMKANLKNVQEGLLMVNSI